jgi:homoserine dehydrogenase
MTLPQGQHERQHERQNEKQNVGLLGAGTVGSALAQLIAERRDLGLKLSGALVRDPGKPRHAALAGVISTRAEEVIASADVVVELLGGVGVPGDLMLTALEAGKPVVTANKAVLAERWRELKPYLERGLVHFEAAVLAGTPAIGPLAGVLRGSRPLELHAILNGTCNYILSQLEAGAGYREALSEAQRLGYAEADPSLDVEGLDAAHKLTVLARLAFDPELSWERVKADTRGITKLTPAVVKEAMEDGGRIRLVGSAYPEEGRWRFTVRPVYLPALHPLAGAASNRNALYFHGDAVGEIFISGAGAGAMPTASAVLADVIAAAQGRPGPSLLPSTASVPAKHKVTALEEVA